jgi:hypothetical protein
VAEFDKFYRPAGIDIQAGRFLCKLTHITVRPYAFNTKKGMIPRLAQPGT